MTVPRIAYEAWHNFSEINKHGGLIITKSELEGLYFLKNQTPSDSIVLIDNLGFLQDRFSPYITLLADRPVYLSGIDNELMAHNINYRKKEISAKIIFSENPLSVRGRELLNSRISYILTMKNETRLSTTSAIFLDPVFANDLVVINKVSKTKIKDYLQWKKTHKYEQTF